MGMRTLSYILENKRGAEAARNEGVVLFNFSSLSFTNKNPNTFNPPPFSLSAVHRIVRG